MDEAQETDARTLRAQHEKFMDLVWQAYEDFCYCEGSWKPRHELYFGGFGSVPIWPRTDPETWQETLILFWPGDGEYMSDQGHMPAWYVFDRPRVAALRAERERERANEQRRMNERDARVRAEKEREEHALYVRLKAKYETDALPPQHHSQEPYDA